MLALLSAACSESGSPDPSPAVGIWRLVSINGASLPATPSGGALSQPIVSGKLTLSATVGLSTFAWCTQEAGDQSFHSEQASMAGSGSSVTVTYQGAGFRVADQGNASGDQFTLQRHFECGTDTPCAYRFQRDIQDGPPPPCG